MKSTMDFDHWIHTAEGGPATWIRDHANYTGDDCISWPYCRDPGVGRGRITGKNRGGFWSHRVMCEYVHGPMPEDRPWVAHSCGNGHLACMNPNHLSWKTRSANALDRAVHGTNPGAGRPRRKLTYEQVDQIRSLKGVKTQMELAAMFGVSDNAIRNIHAGRTWAAPKPRRKAPLTQREIAEIKSLKADGKLLNREIGERYNINASFVSQIFYGKWKPKRSA